MQIEVNYRISIPIMHNIGLFTHSFLALYVYIYVYFDNLCSVFGTASG